MPPRLYLIDNSALAYRSYYAFINNPLRDSQGRETSAIFGFAAHVLRLIQECRPTHIAFIKDLPGPTFRHYLYTDYKAQRKPMPEGLVQQLPIIDEFSDLTGLKTLALQGYEADDIMCTLALQARQEGFEVYLVTRDKDMMQLVGDGIFLFDLGKQGQDSLVVGPAEVEKKMGVPPHQIVDYLALVGDSSDNVPGVAKIGPKSAADLLKTYGNLDGVYANVDNITRKALRQNLIQGRDSAFLSQKLVTLDCQVPLDDTLEDLAYRSFQTDVVAHFLREWEMPSLLRMLPGEGNTSAATQVVKQQSGEYSVIDNPAALKAWVKDARQSGTVAIDTETTGLDSMEARLVGLCLSHVPGKGWYIPVSHRSGDNLDAEVVRRELGPLMEDTSVSIVMHNAKYDLAILENFGLKPPGGWKSKTVDTMVAAYLCEPGVRGISLDDLARKHFEYEMMPIESLIGKGKNQICFDQVPIAAACRYGAEDADFTLRLWNVFRELMVERGVQDVFDRIEMPLLPVLLEMEKRGICLAQEQLRAYAESLKEDIERIECEIFGLCGKEFNLASPVQLSQVLFSEMKLKAGKRGKTGYSTDSSVLSRLEDAHPVVPKLLDYRELTKLKNTYVDALPLLMKASTGRVHTHYSQVIAATGRLSSTNPNLQNIPIRTAHGRIIRQCFVPGEGCVLLSADYSQIELRMLAHFSEDPALLEAYRDGLDIHRRTAAALYRVGEDDVTEDMRRSAKTVNFGVLYGMGPQRLSQQLRIPREQASLFITNYFDEYAKVREYIDRTVESARRDGYVTTLTGRRRYLPDLASNNRMLRENAERIAVNTPIQGSAADLIKLAMIAISKQLLSKELFCHMLLQVHDELVFEVSADKASEVSELVRREMEGAMDLKVPLRVDVGIGADWLEAH